MKLFFKQILFFLLCVLFFGCTSDDDNRVNTHPKVIVLGIDGLDPRILDELMSLGELPNFQYLKETGGFKPLKTTMPPQSPVAWSSFITGLDPGGHGIFDFIHRDPKSLLPFLSTSELSASTKTLEIGDWTLPLSSGEAKLLRKGKAFWEYLSENKIPAIIIKAPANFPPVETEAYSISGMGTPDLLGTYGTFTFYTSDPENLREDIAGGRVVGVDIAENAVFTKLLGPPNPFKKNNPDTEIDFTIWIDAENPVAKIDIDEQEVLLKQGEWSDWVPVEFELPFFQNVSGIVRFFLKQVHPNFQMYVSPININPVDPVMPISTPRDFASELCEAAGYYYTQGMPEDTKALQAGLLEDSEYWQQAEIVLDEELRMFDNVLGDFNEGFLFYYFSSIDQNSHVFWRAVDEKHIMFSSDLNQRFGDLFKRLYKKMDRVVGQVIEKIANENATLIVMSDHGFAPFYRAFHLNTWLKNEGYLTLIDESKQGEYEFFQNVDWRNTKAYALGLNGLYLNLYGREFAGIVREGEKSEKLLDEISEKLLAIKDPQNGQTVFKKIYKSSDIYQGHNLEFAPDLLTGFNRGYRVSWETTLGKIPKEILIDNKDMWSGDHCIAAELVPGVVLSNRRIQKEFPALVDLAPTILGEFRIAKSKQMIGSSIFNVMQSAATTK